MLEAVSPRLRNLLHRRKVSVVYTNHAEATVFLEKLSKEEINGLIRDFGFDFSKPVSRTQWITNYSYDYQKAEQYAAEHEV